MFSIKDVDGFHNSITTKNSLYMTQFYHENGLELNEFRVSSRQAFEQIICQCIPLNYGRAIAILTLLAISELSRLDQIYIINYLNIRYSKPSLFVILLQVTISYLMDVFFNFVI